MKRYIPKDIEPKWQKVWAENKLFKAEDKSKKPKFYALEYFPYPSGVSMHVGHVRNYAICDTYSRYKRMQGYNVLHPMGWDAFGLPAENYAIKTGVAPRKSTDENIKVFKRQLIQVGLGYDWDREIDSSSPDYYKWTQWLFLQFYKNKLAYKAEAPVNWCPKDKTVLANEQVIKDKDVNVCERCGTAVEKRNLSQWFLKITEYADRLLDDLDDIDWPEGIKAMQRNWIGKSYGANVRFKIKDSSEIIEVFTTAHDTIFGTTFIVLAPEHSLVKKVTTSAQKNEVEKYASQAASKTDLERQAEDDKEKTGVFTGGYAINPINNKPVPIWIADYVLLSYGTGAVMAVPGEDARDNEFAKKYGLPIVFTTNRQEFVNYQTELKNNGKKFRLANSEKFDGLDFEEGRKRILEDLKSKGSGEQKVQYKIRDWLISRQRYWGAPIPIVYCDKCGIQPVPEKQLPVVLPELETYEPSDDGRSPLARLPEFAKTVCPNCKGPAERETDTMDTFLDSSWYFLRFTDAKNSEKPYDSARANYWMPVDIYVGGAEHAVAHLLFARFWTKFLHDQGLIKHKEPFKALRNQGMIGGEDGRKMGKRFGNVVTPDDIIDQGYGADALRLYELFIAPYDQGTDWNSQGVPGAYRFLQRLWTVTHEFLEDTGKDSVDDADLKRVIHKTIKKVSSDLEEFNLNTAVAAMMECVNDLYKIKAKQGFGARETWKFVLTSLVQLLAPFAPHIAEELWIDLGRKDSVHLSLWPRHDEKYLVRIKINIVVQVNGKLRANIEMPADASEEFAIDTAKTNEKVKSHLAGKEIKKTVYVPKKLINFVV